MHQGKTIFAQIMDMIPWRRFQTCVDRYKGDWHVHSFECNEFFRVMLFAQLTFRESLKDIVSCLNATPKRLYHLGIRSRLTKSNLAHANHQRDWRIFRDFAHVLIQDAVTLYADEPLGWNMDACVYALDATTIDLCLALFPWARFRKTKGAVKMHTMLNLRGKIPEFILISTGKIHDVNAMDAIAWLPDCWYVMDRGYLDFERLYAIHESRAFFVIRSKTNTQYKRVYSYPVDKSTGVLCDQRVRLLGKKVAKTYPELIRRIKYIDGETGKRLTFLTNNFSVDAPTISVIYKNRWHVELFFKWIKQHLHVKSFYGFSPNAVKSQLWIAVCVYTLLAILRKRNGLTQTPYEILQILSVSIFEKMPLFSMFLEENYTFESGDKRKQLVLFDL